MSRRIYVVIGETGEYSDRDEWLVEAYPSEDAARARVVELEDLVRSHRSLPLGAQEDAIQRHPRGDRNLHLGCEYPGARYRYEPVQLVECGA